MTEKKQQQLGFRWKSDISYKVVDRIVVRGYDVNELAGNISFAEHLHLVWMGELPPENVAKMLDAILVIFAEHAFSPSSASTRMVMSGAGYIIPAMAGGLLSIGYVHVDAHEAADAWYKMVAMAKEKGWSIEEAADYFVANVRNKEEKDPDFKALFGDRNVIPGWHHPQHIRDLRSPRLFELADQLAVTGDHTRFVKALIEVTPKYFGRKIFSNAAGAIAGILCDLNFPPDLVLAFCACARIVGCTAHAHEEMTKERGWRATTGDNITPPLHLSLQSPEGFYNGPPDRKLPAGKVKMPLTLGDKAYGYYPGAEHE